MTIRVGGNIIAGAQDNAKIQRGNIGEIVTSTIPLTDAGLHLLDGGVIQRGSYADFVDYIAGLVSTYPDLFTTEANWQSAVTTYGVCGKFVYDSANNTVRLPKITGFTEATIDPTVLGDLTEAGLPNITAGPTGIWRRTNANIPAIAEGATTIVQDTTHDYIAGSGSTPESVWVASFDASRSSSIYGNSNTVQPQTIKVLYYIVIATSTKTSIEVDIDEIATDLNGKADVDLSNVNASQSAKNIIVGLGMPDYDKITQNISFPFTAPKNGTVLMDLYYADGTVGSVSLTSNGTTKFLYNNENKYNGNYLYGYILFPIEVKQGEQISITGYISQKSRFVEK